MSDQHLSLDALADLLAGEGDAADVDHVATCTRCSEQLADLDAALVPVVAGLAALAAVPLPAPPPDLEARLLALVDDAPAPLAAVPPAPAPTSRAAADDVVPDVVPLRPRRSTRPRGAGLLGVAAGAVGLLALVGLGAGLVGGLGGGASDSGSSAGGGSAETATVAQPPLDLPTSATGNDYAPDSAVFARILPVLLAPGTLADGTASFDTSARAAAPGTAAPDLAAPGPAAGGVSGGPAAGTSSGGSAGGSAAQGAAPADPLARLRDPAQLAGCLAALTGPDVEGVPLALDYASFQGEPALVVVLPGPRPDTVDVFTVGAGCRDGDDRTLFFTRLPRP